MVGFMAQLAFSIISRLSETFNLSFNIITELVNSWSSDWMKATFVHHTDFTWLWIKDFLMKDNGSGCNLQQRVLVLSLYSHMSALPQSFAIFWEPTTLHVLNVSAKIFELSLGEKSNFYGCSNLAFHKNESHFSSAMLAFPENVFKFVNYAQGDLLSKLCTLCNQIQKIILLLLVASKILCIGRKIPTGIWSITQLFHSSFH